MKRSLIRNVRIVNRSEILKGYVIIENDRIAETGKDEPKDVSGIDKVTDGENSYLLPGVIDDQVHFRDPGLTHKADLATESRAAVAGGTTSFMEMPNTIPQATSIEELEKKYDRAAEVSMANYSFYLGATNDNISEITKLDPERNCGVKVFMGSSTGKMLVDSKESLEQIFIQSPTLITTHCEDEETIQRNTAAAREEFGEDVPISHHPVIRSEVACFLSSATAVELAKEHNARLHVLHLSTAVETDLFEAGTSYPDKRITGEVCVHHLWFSDKDYETKGTHIKWNPAIKSAEDREALRQALLEDRLDVIATDHAPHTLAEKDNSYFKAPSGGPMVQHSLVSMLELVSQGVFELPWVVDKMAHAPARLYGVRDRGYVEKGQKADLVLVSEQLWTVQKDNILYKCGWSPLEGQRFSHQVQKTWVNGQLAWDAGILNEEVRGERLLFDGNRS